MTAMHYDIYVEPNFFLVPIGVQVICNPWNTDTNTRHDTNT